VSSPGGSLSKQDWTIQWPSAEPCKENSPGCPPEPGPWGRTHLSPKLQPKCGQHHCHSSSSHGPMYTHVDRLTVEGHPGLCPPLESGHRSLPPSPRQRHAAHTPPRTPNIVTTMTPPGTPPVRRRNKLKPPGTPPPSSRKLIHLIPGFTALHRSKSHEFQLGHRVDEAHTPKGEKLNPKPPKTWEQRFSPPKTWEQRSSPPKTWEQRKGALGQGWHFPAIPGGCCGRLPDFGGLQASRDLKAHPIPPQPWAGTPFTIPGCPKPRPAWPWDISRDPGAATASSSLPGNNSFPTPHPSCPLAVGRSSPLSPLSIHQCSLLTPFSLSPARLKCHNKCTKEAPPCHLLIIHRGDSSSNPSSTTSSTPSSPAPPLPPSATPPSPLHPSPQCPRQQKQFNLPGTATPSPCPHLPPEGHLCPGVSLGCGSVPPHSLPGFLRFIVPPALCPPQNEEGAEEVQESEDDFEEMNLSLLSARNFPRKASQTSIFLQEWDIPFEQLEIGELIGKGRFGQVFHGRWHGEVAIRLIDIERDNEDQLKAFKREVMAYRQTRHENVVLFMGACMSPPHLAIITSLCKGRTLYSVVRDAKIVLDVNKTRQIAQEIVKGMGYLHAKGILHKDLKSKNVFYDNGKVVITDFGLFSISGVLQAGRRENKLRIQNGWLCHLAPEIIRQLSPDTEEDKLPFSKHSDVFALGTIWYELHAREWPFKTQPAEAIIWQVGRGMKPNLSQIGMGKEISDILLFCWAYEQEERPTFTKLMDMLEKLPKRNRRLSHPGHFWKSAE
ncbi:KSR2 Kinase, partial [Ploceus nigricollis]|nr:KSR2 Kinase [Ploceus nigricollis]